MCPPGVDQTCRTHQQWHLLAPSLEQRYDLTPDFGRSWSYGTSLQNFFQGRSTWDAFDKMVRHSGPIYEIPVLSKLMPHANNRELSAIELLPAEILSTITSPGLLDTRDIVALGLSSRTLWIHVLWHIQRASRKGPWVGTPLILTGTYLTTAAPVMHESSPELKEEEMEWAALGQRSSSSWRRGICPARKWNWNAIDSYKDIALYNSRFAWREAFAERANNATLHSGELGFLQQTLEQALRPLPTSPIKGTAWTLRNLKTKEYVSLSKSRRYVRESSYVNVKGCPWLSLDKALVLRLSWTEHDLDRSILPPNTIHQVHHGKWAGHSFDIVCQAPSELGAPWRDVTEEIVKEAKDFKAACKMGNVGR